MTMRYAHPTPENKRRAVNVLAAVFGEKIDIEDAIPAQVTIKKDLVYPTTNS